MREKGLHKPTREIPFGLAQGRLRRWKNASGSHRPDTVPMLLRDVLRENDKLAEQLRKPIDSIAKCEGFSEEYSHLLINYMLFFLQDPIQIC